MDNNKAVWDELLKIAKKHKCKVNVLHFGIFGKMFPEKKKALRRKIKDNLGIGYYPKGFCKDRDIFIDEREPLKKRIKILAHELIHIQKNIFNCDIKKELWIEKESEKLIKQVRLKIIQK